MTTKQTEGAAPTASGDIHKRIIAIMREIPAITKDKRNVQQGYQFRGIDDVYAAVHPLMSKHGVFMTSEVLSESTSERPAKSGGVLITRSIKLRYRFVAEDGSSISTEIIGEGMDSGDKAANKALSVGQKYAILQTFMIPTDDVKDPEADSPEPAPAKPAKGNGDDFFDEPVQPDKFYSLDKFSAAKKALGDELYYEILGRFHANHANMIDPFERDAVLEELRKAYPRARKAAK